MFVQVYIYIFYSPFLLQIAALQSFLPHVIRVLLLFRYLPIDLPILNPKSVVFYSDPLPSTEMPPDPYTAHAALAVGLVLL